MPHGSAVVFVRTRFCAGNASRVRASEGERLRETRAPGHDRVGCKVVAAVVDDDGCQKNRTGRIGETFPSERTDERSNLAGDVSVNACSS